jgi:hypothetical protein
VKELRIVGDKFKPEMIVSAPFTLNPLFNTINTRLKKGRILVLQNF